jgi:nucleotide-binding universal stress UspA family protein
MNAPSPRPIVCGTDFSEPARQAANVAAGLARKIGAPCVVVHGVDERGEIPAPYWLGIMERSRPPLHEEAERLRQLGGTVEEKLVGGVPNEGLAKFAEMADARLVVVASSGTGALGRFIVGSISERIAETAWVPTLVVRDAAVLEAWLRDGQPLRTFVGADFTPNSEAALKWVKELAQIGPCAVTVAYVDREADERGVQAMHLPHDAPRPPEMHQMFEHDLRERARALCGEHEFQLHVLAAADRVDLRLLELASQSRADLIVIGTHQWHGLSRLRHPSVSRRILHGAAANVACIPAHAPAHGKRAHIPQVNRVLAATDLSTHGGFAVPHAYSSLARGGMVHIVHVVAPGGRRESHLQRLRELIPAEATQRGFYTDVEVIEHRDAATAICEAADRFDADLICIGSRGASPIVATALGSVAHAVIARSSRPVLIVRPPAL